MRYRPADILVWLTLSCMLFACGIEEGGLAPEERYTVDTLYVKQLTPLRAKLDSICMTRKDSLYRHITDSIKAVRMEEIKLLLTKNHTTQ